MQAKPTRTDAERIDAAKRFLETRGYVVARSSPLPANVAWLTAANAAKWLGVSERTFHNMRRECHWMPEPVQFGPRALRWSALELDAAIRANAARGGLEMPAWLKGSTQEKGVDTAEMT